MKKRTWLWEAMDITGSPRTTEVLRFCRQNQVKVLYLFLSNNVGDNAYKAFIKQASAIGMEVHAAVGERLWYDPANYTYLKAKLDRIQAYQAAAAPDELFTGVHFDIEPHSLPEWSDPTTQPEVIEKWVQVVGQYIRDIRSFSGMEISAAVPIALGNIANTEINELREFMVDVHDHIVVMSYRNTVSGNDSIAAHVTPFLDSAQDIGRKEAVFAAVETKPVSPPEVPEKATYAGLGAAVMDSHLMDLEFLFSHDPCFGGVAVHAIKYWMTLGT